MCGNPVVEDESVYRIQLGMTERHTKGGHVVFSNEMSDRFVCAGCGDIILRGVVHRFQKQPERCSMCKALFDDHGEVLVRMTRGDVGLDKHGDCVFEEDTDKPSMIPDYYFCYDCSITEFGACDNFVNEMDDLIEMIQYNSKYVR